MSGIGGGELLLAVDLGGTKTAAGLVSPQGQVLVRKEEPTWQEGPQRGVQRPERRDQPLPESLRIPDIHRFDGHAVPSHTCKLKPGGRARGGAKTRSPR